MRNPQGYGILTDPSLSQPVEHDTTTCSHCGYVTIVKPLCDPADLGGYCKICDHLICRNCYDKVMKGGGCTPWEKRMDIAEKRARLLQSVDKVLAGEF